MKSFFKVSMILFCLLFGLKMVAYANNDNVNIYVEIYEEEEEKIFEFYDNKLEIDDITNLKLNSNFEFDEKDIIWSVSDSKIAKIQGGKLQPLNNGTITVIAEYLPLGLKATCVVDVKFVVSSTSVSIYTNTYDSLKLVIEKDDNATHYEVQRATSKNGKYKTIATTNSTTYIDKKLKCGTTYYYRVRAINNDNGIKGEYSKVTYKKVIPSQIIVASKYVKTYNSTYIKWNKVSGADGYRVYRATSKNGKYVSLTTTTGLSYTDRNLSSGKTYYYKVIAYKLVNGTKVFGPYSDIFSLTPILNTPKANASQSGTGVKISISKVSGATGYEIYKSSTENGKYTKLLTTNKLENIDSKITYTGEYYYKVRAYKTVGRKKVYSNYTSPMKVKTYVPSPTVSITRMDNSKIKISWGKLSGCTGYELYISEDGKTYNLLSKLTGYKTNYYNKSGLEVDKKYYIKARSYKTFGDITVYSGYSNVATCTLSKFLTALKVKSNYSIRSATTGKYKLLGTVKKNQIVVSYGREGNYYIVKINNKMGYIHKNYVSVYNDAKVLGISNIDQFSYQGGKPLPMGCEVTSLAIVLNYLGFTGVTKNLLADKYQPRGLVGKTDPNVAFVGTPYSSKPYGSYAPVIVKTANSYLNAIGNNNYQVNNLTGISIDELYKEIDKGNPLIMWMTYGKPYKQISWVLDSGTKTTKPGEGQYKFTWYGQQHCVAIAGYNKKKGTLIIADVAKSGELTEYSISYLRAGYDKLGKQIVSIVKKTATES